MVGIRAKDLPTSSRNTAGAFHSTEERKYARYHRTYHEATHQRKSAEAFVYSHTCNLAPAILCEVSFNFTPKLFSFVATEIAILGPPRNVLLLWLNPHTYSSCNKFTDYSINFLMTQTPPLCPLPQPNTPALLQERSGSVDIPHDKRSEFTANMALACSMSE